MIVHEWGTFTALQDESGHAIGGINVDDEPVPWFVCLGAGPAVVPEHLATTQNFGLPPYNPFSKGWTTGDPSVTMRLETPVIYIYPPKGESPRSVPPLDVHVEFHGGQLSQFYPEARYTQETGDHVMASSISSLTWAGVQLGSTREAVKSDDKVWTTPRETSAPMLELKTHTYDEKGNRVPSVTAEHFLFYRGVGKLDSPLRLVHQQEDHVYPAIDTLWGAPVSPALEKEAADMNFVDGWFVRILPDGRCAYRPADSPRLSGNSFLIKERWSAAFTDADFSSGNLVKLKSEMKKALVRRGLYEDEASAMLRTWELSYFKSPGLRFFYTVPAEWVDGVLPLKVTGTPAKITRVMVGRIELISDVQRAALARLAAGPCPDLQPVKEAAAKALKTGVFTETEKNAFYAGDRPLRDLGIVIPPLVQDYLDLGRFRDPLIVHEQQENPSPALAEFIRENALVPPPTTSAARPSAGIAVSSPAP